MLERHLIIENFLCLLGVAKEKILEETEKIEYTLHPKTVKRLENLVRFLEAHPEIQQDFQFFRQGPAEKDSENQSKG